MKLIKKKKKSVKKLHLKSMEIVVMFVSASASRG